MKSKFIAHVKKDLNGEWIVQSLEDHLNATATMAGVFASAFENRDWGELLGYWHDLGKFHPKWQSHIRRETGYVDDAHLESQSGKINHSTAGAVLSLDLFKNHPSSRLIAYPVAGHHAGLPDWDPDDAGGDLVNRLFADTFEGLIRKEDLEEIKKIPEAEEYINKKPPVSIPLGIDTTDKFKQSKEHYHLWIRMLFSCLVDADFLDTEEFMEPEKSTERGKYLSLKELKTRFDEFMETKIRTDTDINRKRKEILDTCRLKAVNKPGFYSLNVPTGGGKTLSSIAFALEHAIKHDKRRIIVAIPFTSIIEQTAKVLKYGTDNDNEILERINKGNVLFGEDQVIEHHSNLDPDKETPQSRLASENWDAPIIVTTNVQLFESLYASRTSQCRKLHNLVNSVIILDEAQMLPPEFLYPILSVLKGLVEHFGATVLLMTATQPALEGSIGAQPNILNGLKDVSHIIDDPDSLAEDFKRVEVKFPDKPGENSNDWDIIVDELVQYDQVLCIVNTRKDCRDLHSRMPEGTVHLSALMCGEERSEIINEIKGKLNANKPVRVISTQLVEAGVDIDFPVVYRALTGFDSIAQAAGRCNRENKLSSQGKLGKVVVFEPPQSSPPGLLRKGEDSTKFLLRNEDVKDLHPEFFIKYFEHFYASVNNFDIPDFTNRLVYDAGEFKFQFRTFAQNFNLIDDKHQRGIVVWYKNEKTGKGSYELIDSLRKNGPSRKLTRKLQRFVVNVPLHVFNKMRENGYVEEVSRYWVQSSSGIYTPGIGLITDDTQWIGESVI